MKQYYYTVASLPFLDYDSDPPLTIEEFLSVCKKECTEADYLLIEKSSLFPRDGEDDLPRVLHSFFSWERSLRNELVRLRAKNMGAAPDPYIREGIPVLGPEAIARNAFHQESPLAGELMIQRGRWGILDELEFGHYFDLERLIVYKLKLEILENKAGIRIPEGKEIYLKIVNNITSEITAIGAQQQLSTEKELNSLEKNHD